MSKFVPEGHRDFKEVFEQVRARPDGEVTLRRMLYADALKGFALLSDGSLHAIPAHRWGDASFWYEAITNGTASVSVGGMYVEEVDRWRPIFLRAAEMEAEGWLAGSSANSSPQDHYDDSKLLAEMHELITRKRIKRYTAARQVAEHAPGSLEAESRAKRLDAKYKKRYKAESS